MGEFHGFWIMIEETFPFAIRLPTFYSISICLATISPKDPLTYLLLLKPHPFWLIVAVPTTSADASLPSPRVKFSFPSQPTDRNTADDKIDVLESLLLAFSPYRIVSPRLLLQGYVPALDRVWLRRHHNFESCWYTFRGIILLKQNQNLVCFVCLQIGNSWQANYAWALTVCTNP